MLTSEPYAEVERIAAVGLSITRLPDGRDDV